MKRAIAVLCLFAAACSSEQPVSLAETTVIALYQPLVVSKGEDSTPLTSIPMTPEFDALTKQAARAAGEDFPVFDFDPAGLCQDCSGFADLKVAPADANAVATAAEGHTLIQASFRIPPAPTRTVYWDLVETPAGWRVDNILAEGFSLRQITEDAVAAVDTQGDTAVECMAYVRLHAEALKIAAPDADTSALEAAEASWSKTAEAFFQPVELAQYFASSIAVLDDLTPDEIRTHAEACVTTRPT